MSRYPGRLSYAILAAVGAAGSVGLMLRVGTRNQSSIPTILLVLFTGWVLSPFTGLILADIAAVGWSARTRARLHVVMQAVTVGSLAIYGYVAVSPPRPKPASWFLLVPLASWLLFVLALPVAAWVSGRRSGRSADN